MESKCVSPAQSSTAAGEAQGEERVWDQSRGERPGPISESHGVVCGRFPSRTASSRRSITPMAVPCLLWVMERLPKGKAAGRRTGQ